MKLIGFNGTMGVGKSTAIQCLKDNTRSSVRLVKFAQPLYDMQENIYRRIQSVYTRPSDFKKDRKLLQWLGTDWGRDTISPTLWIDIWKAEVKKIRHEEPLATIVCDDVRFDNEASTIAQLGGEIVKIVSSSTQNRIDTAAGIPQHSSEAGIDKQYVDYEIENNGTMLEFLDKLTEMYETLGVLPNNRRK